MDESLARIRHDRSKKDFPYVRLEDDEYVEFVFLRARVCLWMILGGIAAGLILILLAFLLVLMGQSMLDETGRYFLFVILFALLASVVVVGMVTVVVHRGNWLAITNKHVIQKVMDSVVSSSINVIDLGSVEDASFRQNGILQKVFGYGTLRLATVGDETTYTFRYSEITPSDLNAVIKLITEAKKTTKQVERSKSKTTTLNMNETIQN